MTFCLKHNNEHLLIYSTIPKRRVKRERIIPIAITHRSYTLPAAHLHSEVLKTLVVRQCFLQFGVDVNLLARVLQESPELLQSIQLVCATNHG